MVPDLFVQYTYVVYAEYLPFSVRLLDFCYGIYTRQKVHELPFP